VRRQKAARIDAQLVIHRLNEDGPLAQIPVKNALTVG